MSSKTKFFRNFGNQLKNILGLKKNHLAYQAFASEEQFQIACKANDELQFRRQCMTRTALQMRKARRQGCRAKHRWNSQMVRKVAHKCYDIPSCWKENGEYVYSPHMKAVCRGLSLIDLREQQEDIVEVTRWTRCRKDAEEGFSAKFLPLPTAPTKRTRSSVSALFSRVVPCMKPSSQSVTESSSVASSHPCAMVHAPTVESPEMMAEPSLHSSEMMSESDDVDDDDDDVSFPEMMSQLDISRQEMGSESDVPCTEVKSEPDEPGPELNLKPVVRRLVRTPIQLQLETLIIMSHFLKERPQWCHRRINVDEWTEKYREKLRQHYNKSF